MMMTIVYDDDDQNDDMRIHPAPPLRFRIMLTSVFSVLDNDDDEDDEEDNDSSDEICVPAQIVVK